jgi:hypothetical protein
VVSMTAMKCPQAGPMSKPRINNLTDVAFFLPFSCNDLPFSCNEKPQAAASLRKADAFELIEKKAETGIYRGSAITCKALQKRVSQGSGPGGRRFESSRPDHLNSDVWVAVPECDHTIGVPLFFASLQKSLQLSPASTHRKLCTTNGNAVPACGPQSGWRFSIALG